jgi:hypothetical protein
MPLNEVPRKPRRARFPLEFDLMGVPSNRVQREALLETAKEIHTMQNVPQVTNSFLSDKAQAAVQLSPENQVLLKQFLESMKMGGVGREIDLSKPIVIPAPPGGWPKFPCLVYHHKTGAMIQANDEEEAKFLARRGFKLAPSPDHDYSQIATRTLLAELGDRPVAIAKKKAAPVVVALSDEELAELDAADAKA